MLDFYERQSIEESLDYLTNYDKWFKLKIFDDNMCEILIDKKIEQFRKSLMIFDQH